MPVKVEPAWLADPAQKEIRERLMDVAFANISDEPLSSEFLITDGCGCLIPPRSGHRRTRSDAQTFTLLRKPIRFPFRCTVANGLG